MCFLPGCARPSAIGLGTVSLGSGLPERESFALLDCYFAAGGNLLDTAHVYSAWEAGGEGASERTLGRWIRANGIRNEVVVASKGGHPPLDAYDRPRCRPGELALDLEESLERLGITTIDLYFAHRDDLNVPVDEIVGALAGFVAAGRVKHYGLSNWTVDRMRAALACAREAGLPPPVASQPRWALAQRVRPMPPPDRTLDVDDATVAWHVKTGMAMTPFTAQAKGFFGEENAAWARNGFQGEAPRGGRYDREDNRARLVAAMAIATRRGRTANQVALAYLMGHPFPVHPTIGTANPEHLGEAMGAVEVALSPGEMARLARPEKR